MKKRILSLLLAAALLLGACPAAAGAYTEMKYSDGFVAYIKKGEGFRAQVYSDGTGSYIGYGCLVSPGEYPNGITEPQAEALLRERADKLASAVNAFLKKYDVGVTQGQFDALCGFAYNFGTSWLTTANRLPSYLVSGVENFTDRQVASAFAAWCHVGGEAVPGLIGRRIQEAKMFLYDDYSYNSDGWKWIIMDADGGKNEISDVAVYEEGKPYGSLPVPERSGYYFAGWKKPDGTVLSEKDSVTENLRLKASWSLSPVPAAEESGDEASEPLEEGQVFPDVKPGTWYYDDVNALVRSGVVQGFEDGTFRPENSVTWGQALRLIIAASGFGTKAAPEGEHWAKGYLDFAISREYLPEDSHIDLDSPVTRLDIAELTAAALELAGSDYAPYSDVNTPATGALFEKELIVGSYRDGERVFNGEKDIRRSEICSIVRRVESYVAENFVFVSGYRVAIDFTRRFNALDPDGFYTDEKGRIRYADGVTRVSYGIDVSFYQGTIDWQAVAADGIDFAIIRAGYRSYAQQGKLFEDEQFRNNIRGARAAGLKVGIYFFSQAMTVEEAREELNYMLTLLGGFKPDFPVAFDWEPSSAEGSRTRAYTGAGITACARAFLDGVKSAGMEPMIYFNKTLGLVKFDLRQFGDCTHWLAYYADKPDYIYHFDIWQYGSRSGVAGIKGQVDMNIMFQR